MTKPHERVSSAERESAAGMLADAAAAGYLTTDEFTDRVSGAYSAVTGADLEKITAEIPDEWIRARQRTRRRVEQAAKERVAARKHLAAYISGSALMVTIWVAIGLATGAWYPWPIWPILGWGFGVYHHTKPLRRADPLGPGHRPHPLGGGSAL
jgi:hypothetical protein